MSYSQENIKFDSQERSYVISLNNEPVRAIIEIDPRKYKNTPALLFTKESRLRGVISFFRAGTASEFHRYFENNIYSIFRHMQIKCGDEILNDGRNHAQYCHMTNDATRGINERYSDSIDYVAMRPILDNTAITAETFEVTPGVYATDVLTQSSRHNAMFNNLFLGPSQTAQTQSYYFSVPLLNFMGLYNNKPIPLHLLDTPITIEFILNEPDDISFAHDNANRVTRYTISNLQYDANISFIPKEVSDILYPNNEAQLLGKDYKFSQRAIQAGSTTINESFGEFKYKYAKNFLFFYKSFKREQQK